MCSFFVVCKYCSADLYRPLLRRAAAMPSESVDKEHGSNLRALARTRHHASHVDIDRFDVAVYIPVMNSRTAVESEPA